MDFMFLNMIVHAFNAFLYIFNTILYSFNWVLYISIYMGRPPGEAPWGGPLGRPPEEALWAGPLGVKNTLFPP